MVIGLVSDCTVNYRPVFSSEKAPRKKNKVIVKRKKEEQDNWSRVPKGGPIPRLTGRMTVGCKKNSNSLQVGGVSNETVKYGHEFCGT
jgi:hypothetical protein